MQTGPDSKESNEVQSAENPDKPMESIVEPQTAEIITTTKEEPQNKANTKKFGGKKSPASKQTKLPSCSLPNNMQPIFYVGGGNGVSLVENTMLAMGWKRTMDKYDERFKLKWVECKTRINYSGFKEGEQIVNHIPNGNLLTNKLGLLNSLQEYERVTLSTKGRPPRLKFAEFVPETYRLDEPKDKEEFLKVYKEGEMWICKPTGMNQGKGIFIIRSLDEITKLLEERELKKEQMSRSVKPLMTRVVQRYIMNPLLLDSRKFDIRAYMLIASTVPFLVLYHKGYIRLCCNKYKEDALDLTTHLTNQYVQKKDPNYKEVKEDTAWSMEKFNQYINENIAPGKNLEEDWVYNTLTKQMQKIMIHCFNSVKHKLQSRVGFFDLFGLDFMIDTDMRVWLIEVNVNPALHTNCTALKDVIPSVVEESLHLSIECFEKSRRHQSLLPLNSLKGFSVLYCGTRAWCIPARQARSVSPVKETNDKSRSNAATATVVRHNSPVRSTHRMSTSSTPVVSSAQVTTIANSNANKKTEVTSCHTTTMATKGGDNLASGTATATQGQSSNAADESGVKLKMTHGETSVSNTNGNDKDTANEANNKASTPPQTKGETTPPVKTVTKASQAESIARLTAGKSVVVLEKSESKSEPKSVNFKPTVSDPNKTPLKATDFKLVLNMSMKSHDTASGKNMTSSSVGGNTSLQNSAKSHTSVKSLPLLTLTTSSCANILNNPSQLIKTISVACSNSELMKRASVLSSATCTTTPSTMITKMSGDFFGAQTISLPGIKDGDSLVSQSSTGVSKPYTEPAPVTFTSWEQKDDLVTTAALSTATNTSTSAGTRPSLLTNSARSNFALAPGSATQRLKDRDRPDRGN